MAQDDGHRYFFGQMPHAPWKNGDYIMDKRIELLKRLLLILQVNTYEEILMCYIYKILENNQDIVKEMTSGIESYAEDLDELVKKIE